MKIIPASDAPQRSEAWQRLHIGKPTASEFHKIVTPAKLELAKGRTELLYRLAAERLLGQAFSKSLDGLQWIEVGKEQEPLAIQQYEVLQDVQTVPVSFILTDDERLGCSPDALVVGDARHQAEIKCLFPPKMVRYHLEGAGPDHRIQRLGQMIVAESEIADLFCYNEAMPPYFDRWLRRDVAGDIAKVADHLDRFCDELDQAVNEMNATGFFTKRERPATMLDQMVEQMSGEFLELPTIADMERWHADRERDINYLPPDRREELLGRFALRRDMMAAGTP